MKKIYKRFSIPRTLKNIFSKSLLVYLLWILLFAPCELYANGKTIIIIKDSEIENFIKDLARPIFKSANVEPSTINIYIVSDNTPNAFVYGGPNIFVNTGLISFADTYDEIAGVLAHELGHIQGGHLIRGNLAYANASIFMWLGLAAFLLIAPFSGSSSSNNFDIVGFLTYGASQVATASILSYSRAEESHADQMALEYINKTPYSLQGFADFMNKLQKKEGTNTSKNNIASSWYTTHPFTEDRLSFINNALKHITSKKESSNINLKEQFLMVKAKIDAFVLSPLEINSVYNDDTPYSLYAKAISALKEKNYSIAKKKLNILLKSNKNNSYILEMLGDIEYEQSNYLSASIYYKDTFNINKNDLTAFKLARSFYGNNNFVEATKYINISLQINAENPSAWHIKSLIMGKTNHIGLANLALAEKFLILGDTRKAKSFAQKALLDLPKNSEDWRNANSILGS